MEQRQVAPRALWESGCALGRRGAVHVASRAALRRLTLAGALGLLAACGGGREPAPTDLCPRVAIINGLESLEHKDPSGAVDYRAALENIDGACRAEGDDLRVDITIDVVVQLAEGASTGSLVEVPYFVAVSAPNGDVLDRQDYVAKVSLERGARSGGMTESFTQRFVGQAAGAAGYQVLFGFVMPTDEALRQRGTF